ncbi:MAG: T9SS type A sorting domain-containing protein [Cytophagales bacterium]|nr:T9SS type A sorting domain-containing protein [Cytophagales bacterium]
MEKMKLSYFKLVLIAALSITIAGNAQMCNLTYKGSIKNGLNGSTLNYPKIVKVSGNNAFVINGSAGGQLEIFDITNEANIVSQGRISNPGFGDALFVTGNYAYIAGQGGLYVVNVSSPTNPTIVAQIIDGQAGARLKFPSSIFVADNYAYVTSIFYNSLEVIDVSNPSYPFHVASISDGQGGARILTPNSVFISDGFAYVACQGDRENNWAKAGLEIINITNPRQPTHAAIFDGDGFGYSPSNAGYPPIIKVAVQGNYAYLSSYGGARFEVLNVINPYAPFLTGRTSFFGDYRTYWQTTDICVSGNYAYSIVYSNLGSPSYTPNNFLASIDISNPSYPIQTGWNDKYVFEMPSSLFFANSRIFVTDESKASLSVIGFSEPSLQVSPAISNICPGSNITLSANGLLDYKWEPNSSLSNSIGSSVIAAPQETTSYTVFGKKNSYFYCIEQKVVTVNVYPRVTISSSGPITFCQGSSVTLISSSSANNLWSTGATAQTITVNTSGSFTVTANGCTSTSAATTVTVNPLPSATITPSGATTFCQGGSVTLTANSGASYLWSTGATTQSIVVNTSGNYTVRVTNSNGCFATSLATSVVVNPSSSATFSGPTSVCSSSTSTYTAPTGMSNYNWSVVNGTINSGSGTNSVSVSWQSSGSISLNYVSSAGCAMSTSTLNVSISSGGRITASPGTNICRNGYAFLTAPSGTSYAWSTGQSSQSITVYEPGVYSVFVTGVCTRNYSITIVRTGINCTNVRIAAIEPPPADSDGEPNVTEVTVFPNPATKLITVALPEKLKEEKPIYLYNMMGKTIIQSKIPQGKWKVQLALENVPAGIYLVKVGYGDYGVVKKVMVLD